MRQQALAKLETKSNMLKGHCIVLKKLNKSTSLSPVRLQEIHVDYMLTWSSSNLKMSLNFLGILIKKHLVFISYLFRNVMRD